MIRPGALVLAACACAACPACDDAPARPDGPISAWSLGPTMPRRAEEAGVALLGQQIVVAGGFDTSPGDAVERHITARVDAFDTSIGAWSALPDAPVSWAEINLVAVGPTLYLLGGIDRAVSATVHGEAFALDAATGQWRPVAAMPAGSERAASGVVSAPGHIYLLGGESAAGALATCLEYDITTDRWSSLPDLPVGRSHPAAMRMTDGTLIVAGGFDNTGGSVAQQDVWALPPVGSLDRTWQPRMPVPSTHGGCAYGVVLGELVCAGGERALASEPDTAGYDPYLDQWTTRESLPIALSGTQGAVAGGRLFIPGGWTTPLVPTDTLYVYAPLDTAN